jgi:hypothetical protein
MQKDRDRDNAAAPTRTIRNEGALAAAAAVVTSDGGRELLLGSFALVLLALASGSFLFLVTRTGVWGSRA